MEEEDEEESREEEEEEGGRMKVSLSFHPYSPLLLSFFLSPFLSFLPPSLRLNSSPFRWGVPTSRHCGCCGALLGMTWPSLSP
ncbi:hypothetical protein E2C01_034434 [Portunus trituberculatus]|uniref:Uncharacterized protein n=1 Tax=Portunus trituberculatus TaxID=210409 RepID=A0A5B7F1L1_PORTR|nr:hypothetical protein [Portunus trituberculatus]